MSLDYSISTVISLMIIKVLKSINILPVAEETDWSELWSKYKIRDFFFHFFKNRLFWGHVDIMSSYQ